MMTKAELEQIVNAINDTKSKRDEQMKIIDWLWKALIGVIVWIGIGLSKDVEQLKVDVNKLSTQTIYYNEDSKTMKEFMSKPRFTEDDFKNGLIPYINQLNQNTGEILKHNQKFTDIESRILKIEYGNERKN